MVKENLKRLAEITNTPRSKKMFSLEPEKCWVTNDSDILDLRLEDDDDLFENIKLDFSDLIYKKKN